MKTLMDDEGQTISIKSLITPIFLSCLLSLTAFICITETSNGPLHSFNAESIGNMKFYALLLIMTVVLCFTLIFIYNKINLSQCTQKYLKYCSFAALCIIMVTITALCFTKSIVYAFFTVPVCLLLFKSHTNHKKSKWVIVVETASITIVMALMFYRVGVITTFGNGNNAEMYYSIHHSSAVFDNLFNAFYGMPFGYDGQTEQYGHYPIIMVPVLKIIGLSTHNVTIIFAILSAISIYFVYYFIKTTLKNDIATFMFIIPCLLSVTLHWDYINYQINPLRFIGPSCMLALCAFMNEHNYHFKTQMLLGLLLSIFVTTWNTDSGLITSVGFTIYLLINEWDHRNVAEKAKLIAELCLLLSFTVLCTYLVVNAFNMIVSEKPYFITIGECFGWAINSEYLRGLETTLTWDHKHTIMVYAMLGLFMYSSFSVLFKHKTGGTYPFGDRGSARYQQSCPCGAESYARTRPEASCYPSQNA